MNRMGSGSTPGDRGAMAPRPNWMLPGLIATTAGLLVLCGLLLWTHGWLTVRVAWADGQTAIFGEMVDKALHGDARVAAGCLEYVAGYYPSGSKQEPGSRLDRIVERDRLRATRLIIDHLRLKTGRDLGSNAPAWIDACRPR